MEAFRHFFSKIVQRIVRIILLVTILVASISAYILVARSGYMIEHTDSNEELAAGFWTQFLQTIIGGFIGLGTALLIYYKQNKKDQTKEIQNKEDELNDTLVYFKELLLGIVSIVNQQNEQAVKFSNAVKNNPFIIHDLKFVASKDIDRVHAMDSIQIFHSFRHKFSHEKLWIKDFKRMYSALDFIDAAFKSMIKIYQVYKDGLYERQLEIKDIMERLSDHMAVTLLEFKKNTGYKDDEKFKFVNRWLLNFHKLIEEQVPISDYNSKFLDPLLRGVMEKYDGEPWAVTISFSCKRARVILLTDIKIDAEESAMSIGESPALLKTSKDELELVISKIH
jgi:hypothetical protein